MPHSPNSSPHIRMPMRNSCAPSCATPNASARKTSRQRTIARCSSSYARRSVRKRKWPLMTTRDELLIGLVSISDRAAAGVYEDEGIPALKDWFGRALMSRWRMVTRLIPDEQELIATTLKHLVDEEGCHLVLTTGGTGPASRDVTPEATLAVADKVMPG